MENPQRMEASLRDDHNQALHKGEKTNDVSLPTWPTYEPRMDFSQTQDAVTIFFYLKGLLPQDVYITGVNEPKTETSAAQADKCWTQIRFLAHDARKQVCYEKYIRLHRPVQAPYDRLKVSPVKIELRLIKLEFQHWSQLQRSASVGDGVLSANGVADLRNVYRVDGIPCSPKAGPSLADSKLSELDAASTVSLAGSDTEANLPETAPGDVGTSAATIAQGLPAPYSGKRKNWDKLEREVIQEEEKEEPEGEAAAMKLFKKIYADGNEETRKAMMKSYYESGGTCLSTNWEDIGKRKVDVSPPDSMEFKKWSA